MTKPAILVLFIFTSLSQAADNLLVTDAWIKNLSSVVPVRAGYMSLSNKGNRDLIIISVESENFSSIETHTSVEKNGMINMRQIDTLSIRAGETLHLKPGGVHLMMMKPLTDLSPGDQVAVTLIFNDESKQTVLMEIRK